MTGPTTGDAEGLTARRGRPGHDQSAVLRQAIDLFNRQGYDGTSMADLAAALGLTKSAIYHHVSSKSQLLQWALDEALDELSAVLEHADDLGESAYERLRAALTHSVRVLADHLPAVTLLLQVHGTTPVEQRALRRRREIDERLAALVHDAIAEGSLRDDLPADVVSRLLFGMVNSLVEWYRPKGPVGADQLAEILTTLAFDGLAVAGGAPGQAS